MKVALDLRKVVEGEDMQFEAVVRELLKEIDGK